MSKVYQIKVLDDTVVVERYPYGILSPAVYNRKELPSHFADRLVYATSEKMEVNLFADPENAAGIRTIVAVGDGPLARKYTPFLIEARLSSSTIGVTPEEVERLAEMYLDAATQKAIEQEFWSGAIATAAGFTDNRYLTGPTATTLVGGHSPKVDLGILEQNLANCGVGDVGVIHIPHAVAAILDLDISDDGYPITPAGNKVVIGSGYAAATPLTPTMVATGPISVSTGPITAHTQKLQEAVSISDNTIEYIFTREAAVTWSNGCHFAITTDLTI